jgi:Bacterial Ig-like domain (group 3)
MRLAGGDQVQFDATVPTAYYDFDLYAPGTTDGDLQVTSPLDISAGDDVAGQNYFTLQAPYTGTFILAVCQQASGGDCSTTDAGSGADPMAPYTFTPTLVGGGVSPADAAGEVQASPTITGAPPLTIGNFEAGGGNHVDFWLMRLADGDQVQFNVEEPTAYYDFDLYAPGTTDRKLEVTSPLDTADSDESGQNYLTLRAPYTGTFILAVCQQASNADCSTTDAGSGTDPMGPYTFTPTIISGPPPTNPTTTKLRLSATSVAYGREKSLKFSVTVRSGLSGTPSGTVTVRAGKKRICTIKLRAGKGGCSPTSSRQLAARTYSVTASYGGSRSFAASTSRAVALKIRR